ncbi:MAG: NAD-dependent epimerase/dehydratase family protein [Stygiobacter sp.]
MNILVFGGNGFLGSYVVDELIKHGHKVRIADLNNFYFSDEIFYFCDVLEQEKVNKVISAGFDVVYNFAGFASLDESINEPYKTLNLNINGNINILEACRLYKIPYYIYASSAYAMNQKGSFYGVSKLASEKIIEEYQKRFDINFTIIRYGSVYSERYSENNYLYKLIKNAIITKSIIHEGDGEEIREYIHASDAARLSVEILSDSRYLNEHVILTGLERMKRIELFEMIKEISRENIEIKLLANGYDHHYKLTPYQFQPSLSKKLIANPFVDMGQGILEIIKEIKQTDNE